jgi:hypothetical protein
LKTTLASEPKTPVMSTNQARGLGACARTQVGETIDGCFDRRKIGASRIQGAAAPPTSKITTAPHPNEAHSATSAAVVIE